MKMNNFTYEEVCSLKVRILREELKNFGLSSQGLKAKLIESVWSHYVEQRILQDKPDREVPTQNPLPNSLEIGETTDPNGYILNNQSTIKDKLDRLSLNDEGSAQVKDGTLESSSEIDEQDRNLVQKKLHRVKNLFRFILGAAEYRDPGKLVEDLESVRNEVASIYVFHPQDIQVLRSIKIDIELNLISAKDQFKLREALKQSMVAEKSFSLNEFKTKMDTNVRCISKVTNVCSEINNILKINIENMLETEFLGYVANEEERVKDLMEVYTAAADDYTNLDLDEPVTDSLILDTDRKLIFWRRKVDQLKKKYFPLLKTGDILLKKIDCSPFIRDVTGKLADSTLNSTEEANLLSNNYQTQERNVVLQPTLPVSVVLSNRHIRCIDKLTNTASEINNILKINIKDLSKMQFLEYVACEEGRVKKLVETYNAVAEDYTDYDLDEAATNATILDIDRKLIFWRRKVDQLKKKYFPQLKTGDSLLKKIDCTPFTKDVTGQLADSTLNSTEEANLVSNKYLLENETHSNPEIPQTEKDLVGSMKISRKLFTWKLINSGMKSQQQTFSGVIIMVDSPQLHYAFKSWKTISKENLNFQHDPNSGPQIPGVNIFQMLGSEFHVKLDNTKVGIQMLFLLLYDRVADKIPIFLSC